MITIIYKFASLFVIPSSCILLILEQDLQRQLADAWIARTENISEPSSVDGGIRVVEAGAVEDIKKFRPKLKLEMLFDREVLERP